MISRKSGPIVNLSSQPGFVALPTELSSQHDPHKRSGHQISHGSGEHGANTQLGHFVFFVRCKSTDSADLNSNGAQIRESAERESRNGEGARVEAALHGP